MKIEKDNELYNVNKTKQKHCVQIKTFLESKSIKNEINIRVRVITDWEVNVLRDTIKNNNKRKFVIC